MKSNMLIVALFVVAGLAVPSRAVEKPAQAPAKAAQAKPAKVNIHRIWATVETVDPAAHKLVVLKRDGKTLELAIPEGLQASKGKNQNVAFAELKKGDSVLLTLEDQTLKAVRVAGMTAKSPAADKKKSAKQ